jgi:hypothetical protein
VVGFEPTACCLQIYWRAVCDHSALSADADYFRILDAGQFVIVRQCMPLAMLLAASLAVKRAMRRGAPVPMLKHALRTLLQLRVEIARDNAVGPLSHLPSPRSEWRVNAARSRTRDDARR